MEVLGGASRAASVNPCTADVGIPLKEATWRFNIGKWTKSSTKVLSNNSVQIKSSNGVLNPNPYIPLLCNLCGINVVNVLWHSTTALCNSSAETVLPCGHTVAWHCGQEEDPRIAGAKPCLTCMAQQWRHYIDSVIPLHLASGGHTAVQSLRSTWLPRLEAMVGVLQVRDVAYDMEPHIQARCRIANAVLRNMTGREPHISAHPPPRWALLSEAESDLGKYRFVVCSAQAGWMETTDSDKAVVGRFQSIAPTKFGTGAKFDLFSEIALFELMRTRLLFDGAETVDVCVGMVYSYNTIKVSEPFAMRPSDPLAQQVATVYRDDHCYDAVECAADANVTCTAASESAQLLSWESGAAIPLAVVRITHSSQCMLCFENFTLVEGLPCAASSKHFTCWDCLLLSYQAAAKVDAIKSTLSAEGDLLCCLPQCRHPISLSALAAARSPESVLNAQQMLKVHTIKDREISEALARQKSLIQAEYARIEQIKNVDEKTATKLRLRIVDEVLTLRCPRCGMAFIDFDGCFAITCTYGSCRCSFCAWCLQDCGKDAHAHVLHCSESSAPGTLHSTKNVFEEHHRKRKLVKTKALVAQADLSIEATKILKQLLVDDLPDASFL